MLRSVAQKLLTRVTGFGQISRSCHQGVSSANALPLVPWKLYPFSQTLLHQRGTPAGISDPVISKVPITPPQGGLNKEYESPGIVGRILEDPLSPWKSPIEEAPSTIILEKQAARLIVIRRSKMNKHKLRKLRKKMKFVWLKVRQRRELRRERNYLNEKMALIEAARKFDAKEYVASVIRKANEVPTPRKWQDPIMPQWYKEQEMLKEIKSKRYQKLLDLHLNHKIKIDNN